MTFRRHATDLVRLAIPIMLSRLGVITLDIVDTIVVGHFDSLELAKLGLASVLAKLFPVCGAGLLLGTLVMTSHAYGSGKLADCGAIWRRSLPYAILLGLAGAVICLFGEPIFRIAGQEPVLAAGGSRVLTYYGAGLPFLMIYLTSLFFLDGIKRPWIGTIFILIGNALNLVLDIVLVWGLFGLPAMGAEGAALCTTIVRMTGAGLMIGTILMFRDAERLGTRRRPEAWWRNGAKARGIGYAEGLSRSFEYSAFASMILFAGWLGALPLAAYTVLMTIMMVPFMLAVGIAMSTAIRVASANGAGDSREATRAGWVGFALVLLVAATIGTILIAFPTEIATVFTNDPALLLVLAPQVAFVALIVIPDSGQVVLVNTLRACQDTWIPTVLHFFSYFAIMIPLGAWLAFGMAHGLSGLLEAIALASLVSVFLLATRFHRLSNARNRAATA